MKVKFRRKQSTDTAVFLYTQKSLISYDFIGKLEKPNEIAFIENYILFFLSMCSVDIFIRYNMYEYTA